MLIIYNVMTWCCLTNRSLQQTVGEGAEIIRGVVTALAESNVKLFFVTHTAEFACSFYQEDRQDTVYLCAERRDDGERTYKIAEGVPLDISYGEDLYRDVFDASPVYRNTGEVSEH